MKKLLTFFVLGFFALFISSAPICSINQELNKDTVSKLSDFRKQTINTCLSCKESTCKLKEWPEAQKGDANVCKLLFCTPSYVSKFFKKPDTVGSGKTKIKFTYTINSKGKIKDIDIVSTRGVMNDRESYKYLQSFTSKTQFEPLQISGKSASIEDINGVTHYTVYFDDGAVKVFTADEIEVI